MQVTLAFMALVFFMASQALAGTTSQVYGDTITKRTKTAFVAADAGWTTYDSEAAASTATASVMNYQVGAYAGESRTFGVFLNSTQSDIPFKLNDSKIASGWQDLRMQQRIGWFFPTLAVTYSKMRVEQAGEELVDMQGTGAGAGLGAKAPLTEQILLSAQAMVFNTPDAADSSGKDVSLKPRQEADVSASYEVVKSILDFDIGYRYRSCGMTVENHDYKELQTTVYAGVKVGAYF